MRHKLFRILATLSALLVVTTVFGQERGSEFENARAELQAGRDQIIREDLQLAEDELASFWPIYLDYVAELTTIRDRKATLIGEFMRAYQSGEFSDDFAERLIAENFAIKDAWTALQKSYVVKFRKVLSVQEVARFYQLENKLEAEVDAQLALVIPLVE